MARTHYCVNYCGLGSIPGRGAEMTQVAWCGQSILKVLFLPILLSFCPHTKKVI